jgi:hypothetical protein
MKPKYIETPEKMYELFEAYKESRQPRQIQKATPKGVVIELHTPPLTMEGFDIFVMNYEGTKSKGVDHYFKNQDNGYLDYLPICSRIKKEIRQDQIEGGMVGQYNTSITQRLNGLTEKTDVTTGGEKLSQPITVNIVNSDGRTN